MTSIGTNSAAMTTLATLRNIAKRSADAQNALATGQRVSGASGGASAWSIATTMRADNRTHAAVRDALGLALAQVDVAARGLEQTTSVLDEIKARLVAASEPTVDREKIQVEIASLARQTVTTAGAARFNGVGFLETAVPDLLEAPEDDRMVEMLASTTRASGGSLGFVTAGLDLREVSLFNEQGGGILQRDPRHPMAIGGIRYAWENDGLIETTTGNRISGTTARYDGSFVGPVVFSEPEHRVSFTVVVDEDQPSHGLPPPLSPGLSRDVVIDRAMIDAVLPGAEGVVADHRDLVQVLRHALSGSGATASLVHIVDADGVYRIVPDAFVLSSTETSGLDGAFLRISGFTSTVGDLGFGDMARAGGRASVIDLPFEPFKLYEGVSVDLTFAVAGGYSRTATLDRPLLDTLLGPEALGRVTTPDQMRLVLETLIADPAITIGSDASGVFIVSETTHDRRAGAKSLVGFRDVAVDIEPIPNMGVLDIDVARHPEAIPAYIAAVDGMLARLADGAAHLGALNGRLQTSRDVVGAIAAAVERGIAQLVDADMKTLSVRVMALQAQEQLARSALSIANSAPAAVLALFERR